MRLILTLSLVTATLSSLISPAVNAQGDNSDWSRFLDWDLRYRPSVPDFADKKWGALLGLGAEREPSYPGSDFYENEALPVVVGIYKSDFGTFSLSGEGLSFAKILDGNNYGFTITLEQEDTRETDDDPDLAGLPDQDEETEVELQAFRFNGPWRYGAGLNLYPGGDKGVVWFLGADKSWRFQNDRTMLTVGGDLSGGDSEHLNTDFGITPEQSAASELGLREFELDAGLKTLAFRTTLDHAFTPKWHGFGAVEVEQYLGDVADSPLIKDIGDETTVEFQIGFYRRF